MNQKARNPNAKYKFTRDCHWNRQDKIPHDFISIFQIYLPGVYKYHVNFYKFNLHNVRNEMSSVGHKTYEQIQVKKKLENFGFFFFKFSSLFSFENQFHF